MFKIFKIRRLENEIRDDAAMLSHMVNQTEETAEDAFSQILMIRDYEVDDLNAAIASEKGQTQIFQLLLHRQFIGFLAESLRKKTYELMRLKGEKVDFFSYKERIENVVAKSEMHTLTRLFTSEVRPLLGKFDRDLNPHRYDTHETDFDAEG